MNAVGVPYWTLNGGALLGAYMLAVSAATFLVYAADKSAAARGRWRISERTLHLWSLLGGWPGAFLAQHALRHKTRKDEFLSRYRWTVVAHCGFIGLWAVLAAPSFGQEAGRLTAIVREAATGGPEVGWWLAAGSALAGAVSMAALRIPHVGVICLMLLAVAAALVPAIGGLEVTEAILDRILAFVGSNPVSLVSAIVGQCAVALLATGAVQGARSRHPGAGAGERAGPGSRREAVGRRNQGLPDPGGQGRQ